MLTLTHPPRSCYVACALNLPPVHVPILSILSASVGDVDLLDTHHRGVVKATSRIARAGWRGLGSVRCASRCFYFYRHELLCVVAVSHGSCYLPRYAGH
jgi:hypothetical protein